jgi:hypothetical protein
MAVKSPDRFADLCSRLIPRDVMLSIEQRLPGGLSESDWSLVMTMLEGIKTALPDANTRAPSDVLGYVVEAIRAHSATTIEST